MFAKNYHLRWITDRSNILNKYIIDIFFSFGRGFYGYFSMLFPEASAFCDKEISNQFLLHCPSICISFYLPQISKILFQTGDIIVFRAVVTFLADMLN